MRRTLIATADPPTNGVVNPIHGDEGAAGAGYRGALVAGVRTYGLVADTVIALAGRRWLADGWADITLRRPLFVGDALQIDVEPIEGGSVTPEPVDGAGTGPGGTDTEPPADTWSLRAAVGGERVVLDGQAGLGRAAWAGDIDPPPPQPPRPPAQHRPSYTLDDVPLRQPLLALGGYVTAQRAAELAADDLGQSSSAIPPGTVHPWFLAGRMAPLTRHNFTYGPTIHVRTQIQHLAEASADHEVIINAWIVDAWARNDHWYQVLDGAITLDDRTEVARLRHTTIFRPRGTG